jgi:hypothetical protein
VTDRPIDAGQPRLYRAEQLTVRRANHAQSDGRFSGDLQDERGSRVGWYRVRVGRDLHWRDRSADVITEIIDSDGVVFMVVVQVGTRWTVADPDGTDLGTVRPRTRLVGGRLHARVQLVGCPAGRVRERRSDARAGRRYEVDFGSDRSTATITMRFSGQAFETAHLVHASQATPPQRCAGIALAICLQMIDPPTWVAGGGP